MINEEYEKLMSERMDIGSQRYAIYKEKASLLSSIQTLRDAIHVLNKQIVKKEEEHETYGDRIREITKKMNDIADIEVEILNKKYAKELSKATSYNDKYNIYKKKLTDFKKLGLLYTDRRMINLENKMSAFLARSNNNKEVIG